MDVNEINIHVDEDPHSLIDPSGELVDIDGPDVDEDETELEEESIDEDNFNMMLIMIFENYYICYEYVLKLKT